MIIKNFKGLFIYLLVGGMPWLQTGATHCHAKLGLPDQGHAIKGLFVSYVV